MYKNSRLAAFILGLMMFSFAAMAQDSTSSKSNSTSYKTKFFSVGLGYAYADVSAMNAFFAASTPGSFQPHFGVLSFNSHTENKRLIYGTALQGGMTMTSKIGNYDGATGVDLKYSAFYSHLLLKGGYSIVSTDKVKFYPLVGIGAGVTSANYTLVDNNNLAFGKNMPHYSESVNRYSGIVDVSLNIDLLKASRFSEDAKFGKTLGLKVGYTRAFDVGNWYMNDNIMGYTPNLNTNFIYAQLTLGFYRKRENKDCCSSSCK